MMAEDELHNLRYEINKKWRNLNAFLNKTPSFDLQWSNEIKRCWREAMLDLEIMSEEIDELRKRYGIIARRDREALAVVIDTDDAT
jgi:hypothetical protein